MVLGVIGLGKLGLCTAACFAKAGYRVIGMDIRKDYVEKLQQTYKPLFFEPGLKDLLVKTKDYLSFVHDIKEVALKADVIFIIVPTPSKADGAFSNKYILQVFDSLSEYLKERKDFFIINIVSTVMPTSGDKELIPYLERILDKKQGIDFGYVYNPEFIAIGSVIKNFLNPDIVLIGSNESKSGEIVENIYKNTCENKPFFARTTVLNAEIAKLSINCFCTMKISFANNLREICEKVGADPYEITHIIGQDSRIGAKFIRPGLGFGGPCFPRDNQAFIKFSKDVREEATLSEATIKVNSRQVDYVIKKIKKQITKIKDPIVSLLGLAYKTDTYLTEESQALEVARRLGDCKEIKELRVYDPYVSINGKWKCFNTITECVKGANAVVILLPYKDFLNSKAWDNLLSDPKVIINLWG